MEEEDWVRVRFGLVTSGENFIRFRRRRRMIGRRIARLGKSTVSVRDPDQRRDGERDYKPYGREFHER